MAQKDIQTWCKQPIYYSLSFKNSITAPAENLEELVLKQGIDLEVEEEQNLYTLTLKWVKVNKKLYQPVEIEAELFFMQQIIDPTGKQSTKAPSFFAVTSLLLQRQVELKVFNNDAQNSKEEKPLTIAQNCYVFEVKPQLKRDNNGTVMVVRLSIFSMDKLMTLNKYSKAYVTCKLGSGILGPESAKFGLKANGTPLVETNIGISNLSHLSYKFSHIKNGESVDEMSEFIQPYLVQYNESFYDFLVRTSNRCGEFLYFEDGKLTLGLPNTKDAETLKGYASVTIREVATDPLEINDYVRDSMKEGTNVGELNYSVVEKQSSGFPKDAFPSSLSTNAELSSDEYFFPLVAEKFTNRIREGAYNKGIRKAMACLKKVTMADDGADAGVQIGVREMILSVTSTLQTNSKNNGMKEYFANTYEDKPEQGRDGKAVEFGTLDEKGWTTIDYYNDIHKHQRNLERQIICIDMGTTFAQVKLGQKIRIEELLDNYIIVEIQIASEGSEGQRKMTIYAIPTLRGEETETYFPPVQPMPIIRKSGPQTAFVTDNNDPKFQGRVRVAFPWQSMKEQLKKQLEEQQSDLKLKQDERKKLTDGMRRSKLRVWNSLEELYELRDYCNADAAGRQKMLLAKQAEIQALEAKISKLMTDKMKLATEKRSPSSDKSQPVVDSVVKQVSIEELDSEIKKKEKKLASLRHQVEVMKKCAEEHDTKKGKEGYKLEDNNTVALKEIEKFDHLYYTEYEASIKRVKELEKEEKVLTKQEETIKKALDKDIKAVSTPWIRIASPMATPGGGAFFKPRVGDEVLINYDNDNVERPYVVGSLFSKNSLEPGEGFDRACSPFIQMGKVVSMALMSPNGHHITFSDPDDGKKFVLNLNPGTGFLSSIVPTPFEIPNSKELGGGIHIGDRYGIYEIEMNSHERAVTINSPFGTVDINAFTGITINAPNGDVNIKGKNVNIEAGNKVSITSGMNIKPKSIGNPDYSCGSPVWQQVKGLGVVDGVKTFFANIGRGLRYGAAAFGHNVLAELPKELTKQSAAAAADLSLLRHTFEIFVRPVDGTMLIKSKRYLMLEAGSGKARIKSDRFVEAEASKIDSLEKFYQELIEVMTDFNNRIGKFYTMYKILVDAAATAKDNYKKVATAFLKEANVEANVDGITNKAFGMEQWNEENFDHDVCKDDDLKEGVIVFSGNTYTTNEEKKNYLVDQSIDYAQAIVSLHIYVKILTKLLDDYSDDNMFKKAAKEAFKKYAEADTDLWGEKYGVDSPNPDFLNTQEDLFTNETIQALLKRKTAALYLVKVAQNDSVKENKFLELGFDESDIVDNKLKKDYNWKNFMTHFDHKTSHGNMWRIYALEWFWVPIKNRFKNPFGVKTENEIWGDKDGQILFSDNDGATLQFDGAGLKSETQSNLGNRDQLLKLLLSIK